VAAEVVEMEEQVEMVEMVVKLVLVQDNLEMVQVVVQEMDPQTVEVELGEEELTRMVELLVQEDLEQL
jgi:hypothetical protein|tara:strand:+ start:447 stop:650 length:204 start_codon:yes stop_codon:yes gene_type:complete